MDHITPPGGNFIRILGILLVHFGPRPKAHDPEPSLELKALMESIRLPWD